MLRTFTAICCRKIPTKVSSEPTCLITAWRGRRRRERPTARHKGFPPIPEERQTTSQFDDMDLTQLRPQYKHIKALENAPEDVRKVFSLKFGTLEDRLEDKLQQYAPVLQRHDNDYDSLEMQVAKLTVKIRSLQEAYAQWFYEHRKLKDYIIRLAQKRNLLLEKLRSTRFERYNLVMKTLDLSYYVAAPYVMKLTKRAANVADMKTRTFAELKRREHEKVRRQEELSILQAEIQEKIKSGEIQMPEA